MRTFVATLRTHVAAFGADASDERIWTILRHLQILVFDFSAEHGQSEALVRERCVHALDPSERNKAGSLWSVLCDLAQNVADSGGEIAAETLRTELAAAHGFRLAGLRQHRAALTALSEKSQHALQDFSDCVGRATLSRREWMEKVNTGLDGGRYLEVRGAPGVGKSGIIRALAVQTAASSKIIFLSPQRTTPRGWSALRHEVGFEGTAKELLSELAASGGSTLFIDSIDFFEEPERATARDLVREAADIPGFNVVVTARETFGTDEPNWLPRDAIEELGPTSVVIEELTDTEIEELRQAAPELAPLLADSHPARDVVRNLFRLDRLVRQSSSDPVTRTEAEMAKQWWQTGDGKGDDQARERTRILRGLADRSLSGDAGPLDTSSSLAGPLDQLVVSGTLRDLGGEMMIFRHDVFRDWAVANLIDEDNSKIGALPLTRPAPASLARGVELAARLAIEGSSDGKAWKKFLDGLSGTTVHGSWRRAVLMALVRSEHSAAILGRAKEYLLADSGLLLKDLVRMVMALEVAPASRVLAGTGVTLPEGVGELTIPTGATWRRLARWIVGLKDRLPAKLIPDVAELFTNYASASWMFDPLARVLVAQLQAWLMEMERYQADRYAGRGPLFGGGLNYDEQRSLHEYLRSRFAALSAIKPHLAEEYVRFILEHGQNADDSAESVIKSPGNLAQAAPKALAELTACTLIAREPPKRRGFVDFGHREAFTHADRQFLSPSPARGPFLDLLLHSPKDGLALDRQIVKHACTFGRDKSQPDDDALVIELESGPRRFPYVDSYYWSRDAQGRYCVTSALMALEAWGHHRIDAGERVETVITDILGDDEVPAAYLLVIVDLLLSHWPKSRKAAIPFVGSPELLSLDRTRQVHDMMPYDLGMFGEKEPRGLANRESLKKRASRGRLLEQVLPFYLFGEPLADGDAVRARLESATARLGPYESHSSMADPQLMVVYALNQLDRQNYQPRVVRDKAGNEQTYYEYVSPAAEANHLTPMQTQAAVQMAGTNLRNEVPSALENPEKTSADLIARSIVWARKIDASGELQPDYDHSVLIAAALVMRDGNAAQRQEHGAWANGQFQAAIARAEDPVHRHRDGLQFNPIGIAAVGMAAAVRHGGGLSDARPLLDLAVKGDPAAAHGFSAEVNSLTVIDPRLPKSLLRCAFTGSIRAHLNRYDGNADEDAARQHQVAEWREKAANAEWRWLQGEGDEPAWPEFPEAEISVREPTYIGRAPPKANKKPRSEAQFYTDHQAAAVWLSKFTGKELTAPDWLRPIAVQYRKWTSSLNGAGLERSDKLSSTPNEWNWAYYRLVARCLSGLKTDAIDDLCLNPVLCLPDEAFLDVMAALLLSLDAAYFDDKGVTVPDIVRIRTAFASRLEESSNWKNYTYRPGYGVERHLDLALGALFMTSHGFGSSPQCYVTALHMPRAVPFIPLLTELAGKGPSLYVALMTMSIVTVSPDYPFLAFGVTAVQASMKRFPDDTRLWLDYGVGKQFCVWIERVLKSGGPVLLDEAGVRAHVEEIISDLIRLGVPEATTLETALLR